MKTLTITKVAVISVIALIGSFILVRFWMLPMVAVVHTERGAAVQGVYATGTVEAEIMLPIATRWAGRLTDLLVDEGDEVLKDQIMARLENEDLISSLEAFRSREDYAKKNLERNEHLFQQKAVSREAYERAKSEWEAAQASAKQAAAQANFMNLIAPSSGTIIRRDGEIGQLIPANQPIFWISARSPLRITAEVDEEDMALVRPQQEVAIRADAFPGQVFKGAVKKITPKGDPIARSYRVRIELIGETPLQIGMTAETNIIIQKKDAVSLIPTTAIQGDTVWKIVSGKLVRAQVVAGIRGTEKTEIVSGIREDDLVVKEPTADLREGARVRAQVMDNKDGKQ